MVFLSEASIREMVQEALNGENYPSLDGDGNFPITPSPLAEPIVTKLALQPVRVMRIPTDHHQFELAIKDLADGIEDDHLPTLYLKLRELVSDFVPPNSEMSSSPVPSDKISKDDDKMTKNESLARLRAEVKKMVVKVLAEAKEDDDKDDDEDEDSSERKPLKVLLGHPWEPEEKRSYDRDDEEDWEDDFEMGDDIGSAEDDPGANYYEKDTSYPMIGEDPEPALDTWADLENEISKSAWEPGAELDKFRGRGSDSDWDEALGGDNTNTSNSPKQRDTISKVAMKLDDIAKDPDFEGMSMGALHGMIAKAARKAGFVVNELSSLELDNLLNTATDKYIEFLIKQGAQRDENGKPLLSMSDVMDLRSATRFDKDEEGTRFAQTLDPESLKVRKAIQELPMFREYVSAIIEEMMEEEGFAVSHKDAAKDKDKHSVIHRMKSTTR